MAWGGARSMPLSSARRMSESTSGTGKPGGPYTRAAFDERRAAVRRIERREARPLALVSVALGLGQLLNIRWLEGRLARAQAVPIEGALFLAYIALVGWLLWRLQRRMRAARPACPACGVVLKDMSERVAAATGRCDACGGQVIG